MPTLEPGSHIWLTHRLQRDALLEHAAKQGSKGWLNPPIHFLSELPDIFGIRAKPIGQLARRERVSRVADAAALQFGMPIRNTSSLASGHILDAFFGELLPEGVKPAQLENALAKLDSDDFARRRASWLVSSYAAYLTELEQNQLYDPRQIHALIADRIDAGELPNAIDGAKLLHIYALYTARSRRRLLEALARQQDVEVLVHTSGDAQDVREIIPSTSDTQATNRAKPFVQPAPDGARELQWVATEVKKLLLNGDAEPHEIAVVARTGLQDTRRALRVLEDAGIPATARVRTPLSEISALKAMLELFRAAAERWSYRSLRAVLANPYFGFRIDLRPIDRIASDARPSSLIEWGDELKRLLSAVEKDQDPDAKRLGIFADRLARDIAHFDLVCALFSKLDSDKSRAAWLELAGETLHESWFRIRQRVCRPPANRQDIVRLDQRGIRQVEAIFAEWAQIESGDEVLSPGEWHRMLRTLLEKQELVLTTPGQKGVQVLEAHDAATASFKATFLIHANDGEFPRRSSLAGLFTDEERTRLRGAGLPIDDRESVMQRERALWQAVVGSAPRMFISYRTIDPRGTPLLPSLLVEEHDRTTELPRTNEILSSPLNIEQARRKHAEAFGTRLRQRDAVTAIEAIDTDRMRHALLMAHAEQLRGAPDRLGMKLPLHAWNGVLTDPYVLGRIADKFNADYAWSASQLQLYAECPFLFMVARVLRFKALEEAEEETSILTFGGVAHDVLEEFYNDVKASLPLAMDNRVASQLKAACDTVFKEREDKREWLGSPVIWKQKKQQIRTVLYEFLEWDLAQLTKKKDTPILCERQLGPAEAPLYIKGKDTQGRSVVMRLNGRVDRIDRDKNGKYAVIDYKTSTTPTKGFEDGAILQGPLYMEALRQDPDPYEVMRAVYRSLKGLRNGGEVKAGDDKSVAALACAFSIPERVRRGLFEVRLAASVEKWKDWHPGLEVRRSNARLAEGHRFND